MIGITGVRETRAHHAVLVQVPAIARAIRKAVPLITGFDMHHEVAAVDVFPPR